MGNRGNTTAIKDLPNCTVRIRTGEMTGSGVIVTDDGLILTCFHIIKNVKSENAKIEVYFPSTKVTNYATIFESNPSVDVAFLQLQDKQLLSKRTNVTIANLSQEVQSGNEFWSFGFRQSDLFTGLGSSGMIGYETSADLQGNGVFQDVIQIYSKDIKEGMSGAPVLDTKINRVIGIIHKVFRNPKEYDVDTNTLALAIPINTAIQVYPKLKQKNPGLLIILEFLRKIGAEEIIKYERINQLYVPPFNYQDIWEALSKDRIVFITGTKEYGKTYTAVKLLWEYYNKGYKPKWIKGKDEEERSNVRIRLLDELNRELEPHSITYFEDPFGKLQYEGQEDLERNIVDVIETLEKTDDAYMIITSRDTIFEQFQSYAKSDLRKFERRLDIKSPSYGYGERKEMLLRHARVKNCKWLDNDDIKYNILNSLKDVRNLPTPLSIEEFVTSTKDKFKKDELLAAIQIISKDTAESFAKENAIKDRSNDPKKSTVAIKTPVDDLILGTAIIVTDTGLIVTCYHVIEDARTVKMHHKNFDIYFPAAPDIAAHAKVVEEYCNKSSDIAFLQIQEKLPTQVSVARLGEVFSIGDEFQSFGFRRPDTFKGLYFDGKISGVTNLNLDNNENAISEDLIQLDSTELGAGTSGAPILDTQTDKIIGMLHSRFVEGDGRPVTMGFAISVVSIIKVCPILKQKNPGLNIFDFLNKEFPIDESKISFTETTKLHADSEFPPLRSKPSLRETTKARRMPPPKSDDLVTKSDTLMDRAMSTIQQMAERVNTAVKDVKERPNRIEIQFGIKFDEETGVVIAKSPAEASLNVKLTWDNQ
jgi:S1-C subfamily serine protease